MKHNIFLIGGMGVGKTTIGRKLADTLGFPFFDSDHEIEQRSGADIAWIFELEGEAGFRLREYNIIKELSEHHDIVLATGGGTVVTAENRALLKSRGHVVYLKTSREQQLSRVARDKRRPLLQVANRSEALDKLMTLREPLYEELADFTIETGHRSIQSIVNEILAKLE